MSVAFTVELLANALWPQADRRSPLGLWGARVAVSGDGSLGEIKGQVLTPAEQGAAYVYTCYDAIIVQLTGSINVQPTMVRLLTNWPNIDPQLGVQAYSTTVSGVMRGDTEFVTAPLAGPSGENPLVLPNHRFIPLYDPRPTAGQLSIVEFKWVNQITTTYSAECWGYFWDRSVMQAPGGPRHPGSN